MHGGVEDVSYGLQNISIQHSDENKENSVSGQAIGPWTKKWRAKLQSRQLAASSNSIASGSVVGVGNVLAAAAVVGQNNNNVQKNSVVQKKKVKKLPEEKIAERISRKNGKKAQDEQKKKNDIKTVVADISSQQKKKADHLPILPAEDRNYVGRSASSSGDVEKGKRKKKNKKKKGKKGTNGTSSFTTNAKGASVLEMLGDYAAAATATEGASYNNDESTTYPTSVMSVSCIDNQTALQLGTSYAVPQQQVGVYDAQQQYPIYTAAQGSNVLMPAGYYVPNNQQYNTGTVYYNQQPNVPQPVSWALESDASYYMYNGTTYATDKPVPAQTLNANAPVFNPKMHKDDE